MERCRRVAVFLLLPLVQACGATHQLHVYEDLEPRPARRVGCDSVFLSEFDDPSDRCERLGDAVDVPNAFFCSFESSYDRFRADACDLGANVIRYRIVSPCQSVRAEYFSCPVGADSADRAAEGATMAVDEGGGPE